MMSSRLRKKTSSSLKNLLMFSIIVKMKLRNMLKLQSKDKNRSWSCTKWSTKLKTTLSHLTAQTVELRNTAQTNWVRNTAGWQSWSKWSLKDKEVETRIWTIHQFKILESCLLRVPIHKFLISKVSTVPKSKSRCQ